MRDFLCNGPRFRLVNILACVASVSSRGSSRKLDWKRLLRRLWTSWLNTQRNCQDILHSPVLWKFYSWSFIPNSTRNHVITSGNSYRSPSNFENAQVALRWPNRYKFYSNPFLMNFYRSRSNLDRLKVSSMYLGGNRPWVLLRLWSKDCM